MLTLFFFLFYFASRNTKTVLYRLTEGRGSGAVGFPVALPLFAPVCLQVSEIHCPSPEVGLGCVQLLLLRMPGTGRQVFCKKDKERMFSQLWDALEMLGYGDGERQEPVLAAGKRGRLFYCLPQCQTQRRGDVSCIYQKELVLSHPALCNADELQVWHFHPRGHTNRLLPWLFVP